MAVRDRAAERDRMKHLVDLVPDTYLEAAERMLAGLAENRVREDPLLAALENAPEGEEELTPDDLAAIEAGRQAKREGRVVSHDEALTRFGQ
jgi:predicted transcriptional regulator